MVSDLEQDMVLLVAFLSHLRGLFASQDTRVQTLLSLLKDDALLNKHKVVVFSEFRDTARYVFETLKAGGIRNLLEIDSSSKVDRLDVIRRFAPFHNYHVIITITKKRCKKRLPTPFGFSFEQTPWPKGSICRMLL
jgi:hypothetical protein